MTDAICLNVARLQLKNLKSLFVSNHLSDFRILSSKIFFSLALLYNIISLFVYGFLPHLQPIAFPLLGQLRMLPSFADLRWVTSISECGISLGDLAELKTATCDPFNRGGLGYPPFSVQIARFLHVKELHTGGIGFAVGLATIAIILCLLHALQRPGWLRDLFGGLLLLSFPVQLVLERANIDIIILILLTSLATVIAYQGLWGIIFAALLSFLAVAVKMYPFVGIFAWLGFSALRRPRFDFVRLATLVGASLGFTIVLPWYLNYGEVAAQPPAGLLSHGFIVSVPYDLFANKLPLVGTYIQAIPQPLLGTVVFIATLIFCLKARLSLLFAKLLNHQTVGFSRNFIQIIIPLTGFVWLGCYFLSSSFDYRLLMAIPSLIFLFSLIDKPFYGNEIRPKILIVSITFLVLASFLLPVLLYSPWTYSKLYVPIVFLVTLSDLLVMPILAAAIFSLGIPPDISFGSLSQKTIGNTED